MTCQDCILPSFNSRGKCPSDYSASANPLIATQKKRELQCPLWWFAIRNSNQCLCSSGAAPPCGAALPAGAAPPCCIPPCIPPQQPPAPQAAPPSDPAPPCFIPPCIPPQQPPQPPAPLPAPPQAAPLHAPPPCAGGISGSVLPIDLARSCIF